MQELAVVVSLNLNRHWSRRGGVRDKKSEGRRRRQNEKEIHCTFKV